MIDVGEAVESMPQPARRRGGQRPGSGPKRGTESPLRKYGTQTRVARIPACWNAEEIICGFELLDSTVATWQGVLDVSAGDSALTSPRLLKVAELLEEIKEAMAGMRPMFIPVLGSMEG